MGAMSPWHWAIVALVVVILFGSKKLPDAARGLGRSLRIFKSEVKEMQNDGKSDTPATPAPNRIDSQASDIHATGSVTSQPDSKSA
ncbi:twin-arginine translocase TatA/TatE family subunit [Rhodococcus sp. RS1C4]|uniref:Sec-independent protein translocase subunit TatA n=1 Tax=Nocardiaceae TaxID=85025 RepID=UPI00037BBF35|nr:MULTISPECIES: Sec-independent protein translocase subunit TatA [Rhodococcus]OZC46184.1 twin-arginine translocase TatA/TatE family subunit [Rhodococcus sp. RS1C4]OZC53836.1 twin-arginine translocase TatA/TatE family subunit [Rhodococcus sp. 06-621-2]OZC89235.1 twin-arginine translocase TatA/TatE family subunit [Rhodococcus sp. 06-418-1B]OZD05416.1 twin-arginine translocase TatA/TatE family subunit [Rhodococcus sp. 06-156-4C]OZD16528.1 twin-arginine translocase TatA/TatE family subunit [Rhodo